MVHVFSHQIPTGFVCHSPVSYTVILDICFPLNCRTDELRDYFFFSRDLKRDGISLPILIISKANVSFLELKITFIAIMFFESTTSFNGMKKTV